MDEVDRAELIRMMVGRELGSIFPKREITPGEIVLELRGVSSRAAGVRDVSLTVRKGEILGIAGLVGSGRTQLAETIFGLTPADAGQIMLRGVTVAIPSPAEAIRRGIGYVPEDRPRHGAILEMSIAANTSLASLDKVAHHGLIDRGEERALAERFVHQLRIKTPSVDTETGALSGGNQQKVALARWLATGPAILILDEPTQGVDVGSKAEIHSLMADLAERGLAIVMISSELPELLGMSDRIAVMHAGTIRGTLDRSEATQQSILSLALGHAA
jgi:rhamnose transport system ATP-binding protein